MKLTCPFCKTEYSANVPRGRRVACACCSSVFTVPKKAKVSYLATIAIVLVILSMTVFAGAIITRYIAHPKSIEPLTLRLYEVTRVPGDTDDAKTLIRGKIINETDKIYGIPDLNIVMKDENGNIVTTQKFLAPMPLIDGHESVEFAHTITDIAKAVKKISVEFVK